MYKVFKVSKTMVKAMQDIIGEQCLRNYGELGVSDKDKK